MAARVILLILMTSLFAAAWSSDRDPVPIVAAATPAAPRSYDAGTVRETTLHRWRDSTWIVAEERSEIEEIVDATQVVSEPVAMIRITREDILMNIWRELQLLATISNQPTDSIASEPAKSMRK